MRVYELAKELGLSSKELIALLNQTGSKVTSHMSVLTEDEIVRGKSLRGKVQDSGPGAHSEKKSTPATAPQLLNESTKQHNKDQSVQHDKSSSVLTNPREKVSMIESQKTPGHLIKQQKTVHLSSPPKRTKEDELSVEDLPLELLEEEFFAAPSTSKDVTGPKGQEKFTRIFSEKKPVVRYIKRNFYRRKQETNELERRVVTDITVSGPVRLGELSEMMAKSSSELILSLLRKGMACNINNIIPVDVIKSLGDQYGIKVTVAGVKHTAGIAAVEEKPKSVAATEGEIRWPIVVVMGHVDHGKTTLLDYIRKKNVAASEKGGITQHLGAYSVDTAHGKIVFLDTPGHEAFSYIRKQGSNVTDIAILVIAADDGIKPQTIEAIKHAKDAEVPIIVAINKIDKIKSPTAIETVKRQLAQHDLMTEDWGGQVICVPISAKTGQGVDELLEMVSLQAQIMDLRARQDVPANVFILESHVEKGYGTVATAIPVEGVLRQGEFFVCGDTTGKIRLLLDLQGNKIDKAFPSEPVQIVGFNNIAGIGSWLKVVSEAEHNKARSQVMASEQQIKSALAQPKDFSQTLSQATQAQAGRFLNLIIKTDTRGSKEALMSSIEKLSRDNKAINCAVRVIVSGIGDISENDVELASNTGAYLIGLHVKTERNAQVLAKDKKVTIHSYDIIYHLIEYLQAELNKRKEVKTSWEKTAELVVRKVFDIKGLGVIAGCYVKEGVIARGSKVACIRQGKILGEAKINSLQREKKTVKEVHAGFECGFITDGFSEWQPDDIVHVFKEVKEEQN